MSALNWLRVGNPLYKDIQIDCSNISEELTDMTQADNEWYKLLANTVNNHLDSTFKNAVNVGQPCDAYFPWEFRIEQLCRCSS